MDSPRLDRARLFARARNRALRHAVRHGVAVVIACGSIAPCQSCTPPRYESADATAPRTPTTSTAPIGFDSGAGGNPGAGPQPDASDVTPAPPHDDASTDTTTAMPPAWAVPLLGQYAVRARFFARGTGPLGGLNRLQSEWLMLGTFSYDAKLGEVHLNTKICSATGDNIVAGVVANVSPKYPFRLPSHDYSVRVDGTEWSTMGDPVTYGFQRKPLVPCDGMDGQRVKGAAEQRWLKDGLCVCPSTDALPMNMDDCRIDDVDQDQQPGATVSVVGAVNSLYYVRLLDAGQFGHGQFDATGAAKSANYKQNTDQRQLGCNPEPCPTDEAVPCDPSLNPVLFTRLGAGSSSAKFTCDDVLGGVPTLFPNDALVFPPSGC